MSVKKFRLQFCGEEILYHGIIYKVAYKNFESK